MTDRILQRYANRKAEIPGGNGAIDDADAPEDFGAFGWLRGQRDRAVMLELRKKNGNILAVGYGYLERVEYDPSEGITLHVAGQKLRLQGRNLNAEVRPMVRLFEGLTRHRVPWIREADDAGNITASDGEAVIDSIEW